jgi:hypothetical protein
VSTVRDGGAARSRAALRRRQPRVGVALGALLLSAAIAGAQNVTEPSLKAAFIYNFAKFTVWPADVLPATGAFTACVIGDTAVFGALERSVKDRQVWGHGVVVVQIDLDGPLRSCHLLYVSGPARAHVAAILTAVHGLAVLTISDADDFAQQGGIAQMFVENGRMRFNLNFEVAKQSRLQLSSKLLVLGAHVLDVPNSPVGR